jgi:hypothetical protein
LKLGAERWWVCRFPVCGCFDSALRERPVLFATALLFAFGTVGPGFAGSITSIIVWRTITGFGTLGPILAAVGIGTVNVVATILAMGLIDRAGRRTPVDRRPGADGPEPDRSRRCSVGREGRCLGQHGRHIVPGPYKASGNNSDISTSGSGPKLTPNARTNRPRHDFEALGWTLQLCAPKTLTLRHFARIPRGLVAPLMRPWLGISTRAPVRRCHCRPRVSARCAIAPRQIRRCRTVSSVAFTTRQ